MHEEYASQQAASLAVHAAAAHLALAAPDVAVNPLPQARLEHAARVPQQRFLSAVYSAEAAALPVGAAAHVALAHLAPAFWNLVAAGQAAVRQAAFPQAALVPQQTASLAVQVAPAHLAEPLAGVSKWVAGVQLMVVHAARASQQAVLAAVLAAAD